MLVRKGAEANLFVETWEGRKVIMKCRIKKKYRLPEIDERIRSSRTLHESHLLHEAKKAGVPTPTIFLVDLSQYNIVMECVEGDQIKQILDDLTPKERQDISRHVGELIGRLHRNNIIHGDLTTSNMILTPAREIVFVDFGLGGRSIEFELKGVDLHLMKRAFESTHFKFAEECFSAVKEGYRRGVGDAVADAVIQKINEIEKRGRYISNRGSSTKGQ